MEFCRRIRFVPTSDNVPKMMMNFRLGLIFLPLLLAACDQLGLETPVQENARAEADGKAMGGACRQAGRALEDCYQINPKAQKAAVYAGWREMDGYMRENKIEEVKPLLPPVFPKSKKAKKENADENDGAEDKASKKEATNEHEAPVKAPEVKSGTTESKLPEGKPAEKSAETKVENKADPKADPKAESKSDAKPLKKSALPGHRSA